MAGTEERQRGEGPKEERSSDEIRREGQPSGDAAAPLPLQSRLVSLSDFLTGKVAVSASEDEDDGASQIPLQKMMKPVHVSNARTGRIMDPEVWMDYWSDELLTLWDGLKEHAESMGAAVLDTCEFPAFAQFCWYHSSRYPPAA